MSLTLLLAGPAPAQQEPIPAQIDAAHALLTQLDTLAGACLDSAAAATASPDPATPSCQQFLAALDGELVATYLTQCARLRDWRDGFVSARFTDAAPAGDSAAELRTLVGVEYVCGEDALKRRTRFVAAAFLYTQDVRGPATMSPAELNRRLAELQFDSRLDAERRALRDSVQELQQRRELETTRQMQQLENELIRQQINPPPQ